MANIIVKVGRTSNLKFRNIKAFRAITFDDINVIIEKYGNISAVIIENISRTEEQIAVETIKGLKSQNISVFLHNEFEDDTLENIADRLDIKTSSSLDELQHNISNEIAVKVYTAWCRDIEEIGRIDNEVTEDSNIDKIYSSDALSAFEENEKVETKQTIDNKEDLLEILGIEDFDSTHEIFKDVKEKEHLELRELLDEVTEQRDTYKNKLNYTESKLEKLMDIKNSIEAERNQLKSLVDELNVNASIENPVPGALLDEANNKIKGLKTSIIELEQKVIEYEADKQQREISIEDIKNQNTYEKTKLEGQIEELTEQIEALNESIEEKDNAIKELSETSSELESAKIEILGLRTDKEDLEKKVAQLQDKVKELSENVEKAAGESSEDDLIQIKSLKAEVEELSADIERLHTEINMEAKGRLIVNSLLAEATVHNSNARKALIEKNDEIIELRAEKKKLEASLAYSDDKIQQYSNKINSLLSELQDLKQSNDIEISSIQSKYNKEINELTIDRDTKAKEVVRVRSELNELKNTLNDKENELAKLLIATGDSEENNRKALESKRLLEKTNDELKNKVDMLTREVRSLTSKLSMTEDANERLEKINRKLKEAAKKKESQKKVEEPVRKVLPQFRLRLNCEYSGTATIIPVFGSGSYGVTTIVMSIAKRIPRSRILVMDMNTVSPKVDEFFINRTPIINGLTDIKDSINKTSFGALIEKGSRYVIDNINIAIQKVLETQLASKIDYFSGVYTRVNPYKLNAVDFSELMMHLGTIYNYIIVDLGIMGMSDVSDELMRMYNKISYKNIIVTLNDNYDIRSCNTRLNQIGIDRDKSIWVLNMTDTTIVADLFKRVQGNSKPIMIPKDRNLKTCMTLDRSPMTKDIINEIVDIITE